MKKYFLLLVFFLSSCAIVNPPAGTGFLYTESSEVLYYDPYVKPNQKTTMCSKNILGLVSIGDADLNALQLSSSIRKISSIEKTYSGRLTFYAESCLIVKGE